MKTEPAAVGSLPDPKCFSPTLWLLLGSKWAGPKKGLLPPPNPAAFSFIRDTWPLTEDPACVEGHCGHSGPAPRSGCPLLNVPNPTLDDAWPWPSWPAGDLPRLSRGGSAPGRAKGSSFCFLYSLTIWGGWRGRKSGKKGRRNTPFSYFFFPCLPRGQA